MEIVGNLQKMAWVVEGILLGSAKAAMPVVLAGRDGGDSRRDMWGLPKPRLLLPRTCI